MHLNQHGLSTDGHCRFELAVTFLPYAITAQHCSWCLGVLYAYAYVYWPTRTARILMHFFADDYGGFCRILCSHVREQYVCIALKPRWACFADKQALQVIDFGNRHRSAAIKTLGHQRVTMSYTAFWRSSNFSFPTGVTALVAGLAYLNIFTGRPATMTREISKAEYNVRYQYSCIMLCCTLL